MSNDPFTLAPRLWFGVLCHGVGTDAQGRITLQNVINQVAFLKPPEGAGVPAHAHLNALLAVGFSEGFGHFDVEVDLIDIDDNVLWQRPEGKWSFSLGPGEKGAAVLAEPVNQWITQPGKFYFRLRLAPTGEVHLIQFEVAEKIGPAEVTQDPPPPEPPES